MENHKNMQNGQVTDDELEHIGGGGKFWDAVTTEFRGFFDKKSKKKDLLFRESDDNRWNTTTLEMRVNPMDEQENKEEQMIIHL